MIDTKVYDYNSENLGDMWLLDETIPATRSSVYGMTDVYAIRKQDPKNLLKYCCNPLARRQRFGEKSMSFAEYLHIEGRHEKWILLNWIETKPEFKNNRLAKDLIEFYAGITDEKEYGKMHLVVASDPKGLKARIALFDSCGFETVQHNKLAAPIKRLRSLDVGKFKLNEELTDYFGQIHRR